MPSGKDSLRALQFHELGDLARRSASSLGLRLENAARRLLARTEPENLHAEFLGVVGKIAAVQDTGTVHLLPGSAGLARAPGHPGGGQ